jgi:hypothetical protein
VGGEKVEVALANASACKFYVHGMKWTFTDEKNFPSDPRHNSCMILIGDAWLGTVDLFV